MHHRFAIMRRRRDLGGIADFAPALARDTLAAAGSTATPLLGAESDDSTAAVTWIPTSPEDLESPDRLEDRAALRGAGFVASVREGRWDPHRAWARARLPFRNSAAEAAWLSRADDGACGTLRVSIAEDRLQAIGGSFVARRMPVLIGGALGLVRPLRAPLSPSTAPSGFEAPLGSSSLAVSGAGVRVATGRFDAWCLTGHDLTGTALVAGGLAVTRQSWRVGASGGRRIARAVSLAVSLAGRGVAAGGSMAGELLASPSRGPAFLLETSRRSGPLSASARWRRRPGEERPVAGEVTLEAASARSRSGTRARVTWSSWSSRGASDDGRLELETAVRRAFPRPGSTRVRIGGRPGGERYVLADVEVARERGRSFTLIATRHERRRADGASAASTWGGRLDWSARDRAGATFFLQATRAKEAGGVTSWTTAIAPSGEEALVARVRAGVVVTGRAWFRAGPLRVEALLSDAGSSDADPPMRGTLRVEWAREGPDEGP
jgi:hypothetical protein